MVAPVQRRSPRLHNDPDRYIRPVKGGKYQARPFDEVTGERENLGLFATREQARTAIREFWWGKRPARPKFVRYHTGARAFFVVAPAVGGGWIRVGPYFATADEAGLARDRYLEETFGALRMAELLSRKDTSRRGRFLYRHPAVG